MLQQKSSQLPEGERAKLDGIINFERRLLLADLRAGRPNVILVDTYLLSSMRSIGWPGPIRIPTSRRS